jgi:hypothetical protein
LTWFLIALIAMLLIFVLAQDRQHAKQHEAWTAERRELLNRIQRPDHLPVASRPDFLVPDRAPDEWNDVNRVVIDPEYGLDG